MGHIINIWTYIKHDFFKREKSCLLHVVNALPFIITLVLCNFSFAQSGSQDSTTLLKTFTIESVRLQPLTQKAYKHISYDSVILRQYTQSTLSDLLSNESNIYIKSYNLGGISTLSLRGTNAHHTAILWNGFNINNAMNGQIDLSLIPVGIATDISIQYGGSSALWGSGAIGGVLHLNNTPLFNKGHKAVISSSIGSFATYQQYIKAESSGKRLISKVILMHATAQNDYTYLQTMLLDSPQLKQSNASTKNKAFLTENHYLINDKQKINIMTWYQAAARLIPPTMFQAQSKASQADESLKLSGTWHKHNSNNALYVRTAFFIDNQHYNDTIAQIFAHNSFKTWIGEIEHKRHLNAQNSITIGLNSTYNEALATNFTGTPQRLTTALFALYAYKSKKENVHTEISVRQEVEDLKTNPTTATLAASYNIHKTTRVFINVSKVYRQPTLNDMYWEPGGKIDLGPEHGYTQDLGLNWHYNYKNISLSIAPTLFNKQMSNWIIWLPNENYWSPQNLMEVWSRGLETNNRVQLTTKELTLIIDVVSSYVVSTNEKTKTLHDASLHKQLMYVPMYSAYGKAQLMYKHFGINYNHQYTGYRYTSSDNTQYLLPYQTAYLNLTYTKQFKQHKIIFFVRCQNMWNVSYQTLVARPMPLRHYFGGLSIELNKPNKYL